MKLSISFAELQDYVSIHYHKELKLNYVDGSTVEVATPVKVFGFSKSIGVNLIVKGVEGTNLFLSYNGKMGIDLLVNPAISFVKKFVPEKTEMIQMLSGNVIKISLNDVAQLKKVFEKMTLQTISFEPDCLVIDAKLL